MTDKEVEKLIENQAKKYTANAPDATETPELLYFSEAVKDAKKRVAKRQNTQFAIFIIIAVIVSAAMILCFFSSIAVFAAIQLFLVALFVTLRLFAHHMEATR